MVATAAQFDDFTLDTVLLSCECEGSCAGVEELVVSGGNEIEALAAMKQLDIPKGERCSI